MAQITQKDIAEALNISRETVTKAMLDHPKVSTRTKEIVSQKAAELGYIPNFFARNLSSGTSKIIGLVIPKIAHSFFSTMTEEIYKQCRERGYTVITMISYENEVYEQANLKTLLSMRVDGVIACISKETEYDSSFMPFRENGIPIVLFDRVFDEAIYNRVVTNDREIACKAVSYALEKGYKRPAHLAGYSRINIGKMRRMGFIDAVQKHGLVPNEAHIIEGGFTFQDGYENAMTLLQKSERPDFIFAINDTVAHGVYQAAKENGIQIPHELGIIGFGNLEIGSLLNPPLTSVMIPINKMANKAVEMVIDQISESIISASVKSVIPAELIIRSSC